MNDLVTLAKSYRKVWLKNQKKFYTENDTNQDAWSIGDEFNGFFVNIGERL